MADYKTSTCYSITSEETEKLVQFLCLNFPPGLTLGKAIMLLGDAKECLEHEASMSVKINDLIKEE